MQRLDCKWAAIMVHKMSQKKTKAQQKIMREDKIKLKKECKRETPIARHWVVVPPEHIAAAAATHVQLETHQAHPDPEAAQWVHPSAVKEPQSAKGQHC